jgi:competence protein ComGC
MAKNRRKKSTCLNCKVKLSSNANFCSNCGQENNDKRVPVKHLFRDFMVDYLTFDSKFFRSISPLLFKPGHLSKEFTKGKRQNYVQPLRLYIFISVLFFFAVNFLIKDNNSGNEQGSGANFTTGQLDLKYLETEEGQEKLDQLGEEAFLDSMQVHGSFNRLVGRKMIKLANTGTSINEYLVKNTSIMMFFLLPIFAFLLKLFFRKQKYFYVEHLVFTLHMHAFAYLFFIIYLLVAVVFALITGLHGNLIFSPFVLLGIWLIYLLLAVHYFYKEGWGKTIFKSLLTLFSYNVLLVGFLLATLFLSILLF